MDKEQQGEMRCPFCGGQTEAGWIAGGPRSLSWIPGGKGLLGKLFGWPFAEKIGEGGFRDMTIPRMVGSRCPKCRKFIGGY